jgi:hypothetical protein
MSSCLLKHTTSTRWGGGADGRFWLKVDNFRPNLIFSIRVTDTNAKLYRPRDPAKVIATQEKEKKWKYLKACL